MEKNPVNVILSILEERSDVHPIGEEMSFEQLGMDSLDFIEAIQEVREKVGPVSEKQAQSCENVADLIKVFRN